MRAAALCSVMELFVKVAVLGLFSYRFLLFRVRICENLHHLHIPAYESDQRLAQVPVTPYGPTSVSTQPPTSSKVGAFLIVHHEREVSTYRPYLPHRASTVPQTSPTSTRHRSHPSLTLTRTTHFGSPVVLFVDNFVTDLSALHWSGVP